MVITMAHDVMKTDIFKYISVLAKLGGEIMAELPIAPVGSNLRDHWLMQFSFHFLLNIGQRYSPE